MLNKDLFIKDPTTSTLMNNGVAVVNEHGTAEELKTLHFELENFVCEGEYARGMERILRSFSDNIGSPEQPAVWVSGFYGSGKSHLVKMLRYLWVDHAFQDGATARGIAHLPEEIKHLLKELSTQGTRLGGLHAASGTLGASSGESVRLALLAIILRSAGLPERYPLARFVMYLRDNGLLDGVKAELGDDFDSELRNMYVSTDLAKALLKVDPDFAGSAKEVKGLLKETYPNVTDISNDDMVAAIREAIGNKNTLPLTLIVLDEAQQYIGEDPQRSYDVQEVTETCCKQLGGRVLFVATGQTALTNTPQLQKLKGRYKVLVQLSDTDVEAVTRQIVLKKKADKEKDIEDIFFKNSGEVSRHLTGTAVEPVPEDKDIHIIDYPLLPVRRRFWEKVVHAVDKAGTAGQLRTQLRIIFDAVKEFAEKPLGHVIPADFLFDQTSTEMQQTGVLLREIDELIRKQKDGTKDGDLRSRLLALIFLIGQLPREVGSDTRIRATADTLADLLVEDLQAGSDSLRTQVESVLDNLVQNNSLMRVDDEYRIQTRESRAWNQDYQGRYTKTVNDGNAIAAARSDKIRHEVSDALKSVKILQGLSKVPRKLNYYFNDEAPDTEADGIPVWIRDEWNASLKSITDEARQRGTDDPVIHVFLPNRQGEELKKSIARAKASQDTLYAKGSPTTDEGQEAMRAMETQKNSAEGAIKVIIADVIGGARVFLGGGTEVNASGLAEMVEQAVGAVLARKYPKFSDADHPNWGNVVAKARKGSADSLKAVSYEGEVEKHPVCREILHALGSWQKGKEIRKAFMGGLHGWPQDAIDGALLALLIPGHIKARLKNGTVNATDLDQRDMAQAEFKSETVVIKASERMLVRKLYTDAGVKYKNNEEIQAAPLYVRAMLDLAADAGGDEPWPETPKVLHLKEAENLSGNDQLKKLCELHMQLADEAKEWKKAAELIEKRKERWEALGRLLKHAEGLPEAKEVAEQMDAIRVNRTGIEKHDPIGPLCDTLTKALRKALNEAFDHYGEEYQEQLKALKAHPAWGKTPEDKQQAFMREAGLAEAETPKLGTEAQVLAAMDDAPLSVWTTRTQALPTQFGDVLRAAVKLVEPKAFHMKLPCASLKTEADVDKWLTDVKADIMKKLNDPDTGSVEV